MLPPRLVLQIQRQRRPSIPQADRRFKVQTRTARREGSAPALLLAEKFLGFGPILSDLRHQFIHAPEFHFGADKF